MRYIRKDLANMDVGIWKKKNRLKLKHDFRTLGWRIIFVKNFSKVAQNLWYWLVWKFLYEVLQELLASGGRRDRVGTIRATALAKEPVEVGRVV